VLAVTEPWFLDRPLSLGGELYFREANFLSALYDQRNYGGAVHLRKPLARFLSASVEYRLERIEIFDVSTSLRDELAFEEGTNTKSQVTTSFVFDTRDNPFFTRRGQRVVLTPYVSGGFLGGDSQIFGFDLEMSQYIHLPWDMVLLLNGEIASVEWWGDTRTTIRDGMTVPIPDEFDVPIYDRLFLGGPNNLRGFSFRDVGPKNQDGEPLGGKTLARATVELTFPIIEKVRGAIFSDIGFVEPNAFDPGGRPASDVGIGLRLDLPVGPIRVDYGFPVQTGGNNDRGGKFNFNVGYQF
jgi:outer membrane protein insertion porin family